MTDTQVSMNIFDKIFCQLNLYFCKPKTRIKIYRGWFIPQQDRGTGYFDLSHPLSTVELAKEVIDKVHLKHITATLDYWQNQPKYIKYP
jgi:hypothetical protein